MSDTLAADVRAACDAAIPSESECPWPNCSCLCDEKDGSAILTALLTTARAKATEAERERMERVLATRTAGYHARKDTIYSGAIVAAELRAIAAAIRAPATPPKDPTP